MRKPSGQFGSRSLRRAAVGCGNDGAQDVWRRGGGGGGTSGTGGTGGGRGTAGRSGSARSAVNKCGPVIQDMAIVTVTWCNHPKAARFKMFGMPLLIGRK